MFESRQQSPEAALVTAILMQAYRDLFLTATSGHETFTTQSEQNQAIAFLTDQTGPHARHRAFLCSLIGWDGNVLGERVRRMMEGADFPPTDKTPAALKRHAKAVKDIRTRWQHLKYPHALPASSV
ncbi:hypothetical protein K3556_07325 [Aliiroseovarius sp. M344]|uniref:hypothetical protein n=1 Tax=Aliiroseovarius sp. M344 TaxID=2867010 RepID=UPI0021ADD19F|nr:hypothetical protein [Aliiroseovarius sp. M344]UWQ15675.1 hypothetical protein K3556_07325 [Aliiroseovarius sp. M344]